ncbi:MAG: DUF3291 domain-containing protein [Brevundimonas sp.]|nr:DUF3291 domain-containing protein [Brevundimonas sp.]
MSAARHVAQINVARFRVAKDDPVNADFMAALDHVNAMAEASVGFVWRLTGDGNDATDVEAIPGDPNLIINMSVWRDVAALEQFAYRQPDHRQVLGRRQEWFDPIEPSFALWWVKAGHIPSVSEGMARLAQLENEGPGNEVFTFRHWRQHLRASSAA